MARTLVLDQDVEVGQLIGRVLLENGHEVVTFAEHKLAITWAQNHPPQLAIVSLEPSRTQGLVLWKRLKMANKHLRVLLLARYAQRDLAREAVSQWADDYLLRPIEIEKLEKKVKKLTHD